MLSYILRRIGLMIPTLFGIMLITFAIVQFAPGGPVEQVLSKMQGQNEGALSRVTGGNGDLGGGSRGGGSGGAPPIPAIAARRASARNSSPSSKSSSASTSRRPSASR